MVVKHDPSLTFDRFLDFAVGTGQDFFLGDRGQFLVSRRLFVKRFLKKIDDLIMSQPSSQGAPNRMPRFRNVRRAAPPR